MNSLYYLYYRLFNYYRKANDIEIFATISTYLCIVGLLWINIGTILFFVSTIFFNRNSLLDIVFTDNSAYNRFVITPLLIAPIFIVIFLLINKGIKQKIEEFDSESAEERKQHGKKVLAYIILSIIMLMLSITSPLYL
jgi:hypothetical protein